MHSTVFEVTIKIKMKFKVIQSVCCAFLIAGSSLVAAETEKDKDRAKLIQQVGKETNLLSEAGAAFALKSLQAKDKLAPFALVLKNNNEISVIQPVLDYLKKAPIADKINFLRGQIKHHAEQGSIKAGALYSRGYGRTADDKTKQVVGIIVEQEHRFGPSTLQFVPYEKKDGKYAVLQETSRAKPRLFFNDAISSEKTYEVIKGAVKTAQENK